MFVVEHVFLYSWENTFWLSSSWVLSTMLMHGLCFRFPQPYHSYYVVAVSLIHRYIGDYLKQHPRLCQLPLKDPTEIGFTSMMNNAFLPHANSKATPAGGTTLATKPKGAAGGGIAVWTWNSRWLLFLWPVILPRVIVENMDGGPRNE